MRINKVETGLVKKQSTEISVYSPVKAIELRREALTRPELLETLTKVELTIFTATTKDSISMIDDDILATKLSSVIDFIAKDVGIMKEVEPYQKARMFQVLRKYYNEISLPEISLAFELAAVGELDDYLLKNGDGKPDKHHYQQFNIEYLSKILTAYIRKKNTVVHKAISALPEPKKELSREHKLHLENSLLDRIVVIYLKYKYTDDYESMNDLLYCETLQNIGLITDFEISEEDKKDAMHSFLVRASKGLVNKFTAEQIASDINHKEIPGTAYLLRCRKEIIECFDYMIKEELQILDYIKLKE